MGARLARKPRFQHALVVGNSAVVRQAGPSAPAGLEAGLRHVVGPRAEAVHAARHINRVADMVVHEHSAAAVSFLHPIESVVLPVLDLGPVR